MIKFNIDQYPVIYGNNILLRPIQYKDTDLIVKWRNNLDVRKNFIFREPFTKELHENWMKTKVNTGEVIQYIIEDNFRKTAVGSVYFRDLDYTNESAEFGIFIGESEYRGKGIGYESTKLFVNWGGEHLKLHRIFLRLLSTNLAAYKIYEKAGFKQEGYFHDMVKIENIFYDIIFMAKFF